MPSSFMRLLHQQTLVATHSITYHLHTSVVRREHLVASSGVSRLLLLNRLRVRQCS